MKNTKERVNDEEDSIRSNFALIGVPRGERRKWEESNT